MHAGCVDRHVRHVHAERNEVGARPVVRVCGGIEVRCGGIVATVELAEARVGRIRVVVVCGAVLAAHNLEWIADAVPVRIRDTGAVAVVPRLRVGTRHAQIAGRGEVASRRVATTEVEGRHRRDPEVLVALDRNDGLVHPVVFREEERVARQLDGDVVTADAEGRGAGHRDAPSGYLQNQDREYEMTVHPQIFHRIQELTEALFA